jgi:hypothetical protein
VLLAVLQAVLQAEMSLRCGVLGTLMRRQQSWELLMLVGNANTSCRVAGLGGLADLRC